ncbi:sporulation histidine kinase inhibitor Sda [Shouchella shacheensis]|nr:sporulation histidine kinase inhibitor Sda [Shouchella shacheensis]
MLSLMQDDVLKEAYEEAIESKLDPGFISILEEELVNRLILVL